MTRYKVMWANDVEEPFINYWIKGNSQTRAVLTEIANWIDTALSQDPDLKGRLREDLGARVIAVKLTTTPAHISVTYEVIPEDRLVRVILLTISF